MSRWVDAEWIKDRNSFVPRCELHTVEEFMQILDEAPTIDAVPVVRCRDCKCYNAGFECLKEGYGIEHPQDWFCADGERKDDDQRRSD